MSGQEERTTQGERKSINFHSCNDSCLINSRESVNMNQNSAYGQCHMSQNSAYGQCQQSSQENRLATAAAGDESGDESGVDPSDEIV